MNSAGTWSTDGLSRERASDAWSRKMPELHLAWSLSFPKHERFEATVRYRRSEELTIADFRGGRYSGRRSFIDGSRDEPPSVGVLVNLSGHIVCRLGGREVVVDPGDLLLWDSERAQGFDAFEPHRELSVLFPRDRAPQGLAAAASRMTRTVPARPGAGLAAVAADQLRAIARELDRLDDAALSIACRSLFDTLDASLATVQDRSPSPGARASLLLRVRRYVEEHLDDPELCVPSIAKAHGISVRTLHLAFADTGTTVSRWVRERRLGRCYRDLAHAAADTTVTDIAFRWGFNDAAHFSRTFKRAFGVPPSTVMALRMRP